VKVVPHANMVVGPWGSEIFIWNVFQITGYCHEGSVDKEMYSEFSLSEFSSL
jgi:hypothetical protein